MGVRLGDFSLRAQGMGDGGMGGSKDPADVPPLPPSSYQLILREMHSEDVRNPI